MLSRETIIQLNKDMPESNQYQTSVSRFACTEEKNDQGNPIFEANTASAEVSRDFRKFTLKSLENINADYNKGQPVVLNHQTGGEILPNGRTVSSKYDKSSKIVQTRFYLDDEDYNARLLKGIKNKTVRDVSAGGRGKTLCSFDGTPMYFFGCMKGHVKGDEILLDKDGNETWDPAKSVRTELILGIMHAETAEELSICTIGAIANATIQVAFNSDPHLNQQIINTVKSAYDNNLIDDFGLERLAASYGGAEVILNAAKPEPTIFLPNIKTEKEVKTPMSTELTPEVQATIDELKSGKKDLQEKLDAALTKVSELETAAEEAVSDEDIQAAATKIAELETLITDLETDRDNFKAKSDLYDKLVLGIRPRLKSAKRKKGGISEEDLVAFNTKVDTMVDADAMLDLLDEIDGQKASLKNFSRVIAVKEEKKKDDEAKHTEIEKLDFARTMASF